MGVKDNQKINTTHRNQQISTQTFNISGNRDRDITQNGGHTEEFRDNGNHNEENTEKQRNERMSKVVVFFV